jgi:hypothetical protein
MKQRIPKAIYSKEFRVSGEVAEERVITLW